MALLSSLAYARTRVRQGKTGQRVRLSAVVTASVGGGPFNLTRRGIGNFARASQRSGSPWFAWSDYPTPPLAHDVQVSAPTCTEPRFAWQPGGRLIFVCNRQGTIEARASDDDGLSWGLAEETFDPGSHPDVTSGRAGVLVSLAYRSGEIVGTRQWPAGAAPSAEFTLEDDSSAPLSVEDDVFRLVEDTTRGWWWLHVRPAGGGGTQLYFSTDIDVENASFAETSGAVPGITGGLSPGMCMAENFGTIYAWARIGTSGWITHRHAGDPSWATPVEMVDTAGDPLELAAQPFSIAAAWEGPSRLVLSAVTMGATVVSEFWSADLSGESWTPFS